MSRCTRSIVCLLIFLSGSSLFVQQSVSAQTAGDPKELQLIGNRDLPMSPGPDYYRLPLQETAAAGTNVLVSYEFRKIVVDGEFSQYKQYLQLFDVSNPSEIIPGAVVDSRWRDLLDAAGYFNLQSIGELFYYGNAVRHKSGYSNYWDTCTFYTVDVSNPAVPAINEFTEQTLHYLYRFYSPLFSSVRRKIMKKS